MKKDSGSLVLRILVIAEIIAILFAFTYIIYSFKKQKPVVNNYNIEHVDQVIITDTPTIDNNIQNDGNSFEDQQIVETPPVLHYDIPDMDEFVFLNTKDIAGWTPCWDLQYLTWKMSRKYNINHFQQLTILLNEKSKNNQFVEHVNDNGTIDIGDYQINSKNVNLVKRIRGSEDISWLKDRPTNVEAASMKLSDSKRIYPECKNDIFYSFAEYNGGYTAVQNMESGKWTENCVAGKYANKCMDLMDKVYVKYLEACDEVY